uniref:Major facilitator superfamily (MFS) profile domain-containing protein n=1 Tax=Batrachochytrium dendrobatidis (strain JAM81 / FGSC 10211) TaxID=684364 RepID=F4PF56_BATDJ|eukprot:XP_006683241.1 hypothetical protein BATDEDRAFT_28792 [Batrachochytrium dendrobatidis JAM81]
MKQKPKLWTKDFVMVSASNFLLFISFYMLMVTLALYSIEKFSASQSQAGLASSIFVIGAVLVRPIAGKTIEKIVNNLALLLIIRFIHGFAFGISTTATGTIVADLIPPERRGEGMGYFATSTNLAMAIGPFLGLYISQNFEYNMIFITTTVFSVVALIATLFLRVPKLAFVPGEGEAGRGFRLSDYFEKSTLGIGILVALLGFAYSSILSFFTAYAAEINLVDAASFFFVMYAIFLLISRPFTGQMFDRLGENAVIYPSLLLFGIGMFTLSQASIGITLLLAGAIIGIGFGTFQSSAQTVAINEAPRHRIGLATSTYFVFFDTGIGVGPFLLGFILPLIGFRGLYAGMAAIVIICLFVYYIVHGKKAAARKKARGL